mgnify:CR=1 FL=1
MDWYVIQAYSGYEQKVKAALEERIMLNNLSEKFGEILIPTEQIVELKAGTKKTTERKFFPGYILIQMNLEDDSWQLVQSTPRVSERLMRKRKESAKMLELKTAAKKFHLLK